MDIGWPQGFATLLVSTSLRLALVAAAVWLVLRVARVRDAALRHVAWRVVLAAMVVMPFLPGVVPSIPVPAPVASVAAPLTIEWPASSSSTTDGDTASVAPLPTTATSPHTAASTARPAAPWRWQPALVLRLVCVFYAIGAILFASRLLVGWRGTRRLVHLSERIERPDDGGQKTRLAGVRQSDGLAAPVTAGVFAPSVLLPADWVSWSPDRLRSVLAHERAHIARRDPLVAVLARVVRCVYWFHPLAWWLERELAVTAEHACDDVAVSEVGSARPYAEALLATAEAVRAHGGRIRHLGVAVDGTGLAARIERILGRRVPPAARALRVGVLAVGVGAVIGIASCHGQVSDTSLRPDPDVTATLARQEAADAWREAQEKLTPEQVHDLEATLVANPEDLDARERLLTFYQSERVRQTVPQEAFNRHVLWLIERHPESPLHRQFGFRLSGRSDPGSPQTGESLWRAHLQKAPLPVEVLGNAASFFWTADPALTESLLRRAIDAAPAGTTWQNRGSTNRSSWTRDLGMLYAEVSFAAAGETPAGGRAARPAPPHVVAFARTLRDRLTAEANPKVLYALLWRLQFSTSDAARETSRLCAARLARLRTVSAESRMLAAEAARTLRQLERSDILRGVPRDDQPRGVAALPEAQRFLVLPGLSVGEYLRAENASRTVVGGRPPAESADMLWARSKQYATDALSLAPAYTDHPSHAADVYSATITLGTHALREGDAQTAARYLLRAADGPRSEELALCPNVMAGTLEWRLTNYLLRAGERDAVATFYEKTGAFMEGDRDRRLKAAANIRKGVMPEGYQVLFAREAGGAETKPPR